METAKRLQDTRRHATVECIPVPPKVASKAPLYFKKSIDDAEDEWAQHHAKRWIDTTAKASASYACCIQGIWSSLSEGQRPLSAWHFSRCSPKGRHLTQASKSWG